MTTKVVKGSLWTLAGQVAPMAFSLIATPFVIRMLGSEAYGVLILIALIPTYFGFADFGMSFASTKFGSEAYAQGDAGKEAKVVRTAALIATITALPIAISLFAFSTLIVGIFNVAEQFRGDASLALKFAAVTFFVNALNPIFNTPQLTRLRMDLNTLIGLVPRVLGIIATPFVIYYRGIPGAVFVLMISSIVTLLGHLTVSRRLLPELWGVSIDRDARASLLRFGGALVISSIAAIFLMNAEKGILGASVSPAALAHYSVAFTFASMVTMFSSAMLQSLLPAFSQLQEDSDREHLNSLYSRGIRMNLIWLIPAVVIMSIVAQPFFTVWAGEEFGRESVIPFYFLLIGLLFNVTAYFPSIAIMAAGRTDIFAKIYWAELGPYALLIWILASKYGAAGAALAWSIRVTADALVMYVVANKVARVSFLRDSLAAFFLGGAVMLLPFGLNLYFGGPNIAVIVISILSLGIYGLIIWKHLLNGDEVAWLVGRFNAVFAR